ncbi:hypothetical protein [Umezawaea sp. Da 62-37]|uniref:hypothetical protein n=1 Tax=Umezawaea sp. Da 62-37 TaxID=3075927 RepID=UPI0028F6E702|nr:hypothetical protein [Umezawaea sp. Da 62-37]WNV91530.1 hypothetical protein RM788_25710 [Umezawaea sp. Da 62-37]
MSTAEMISDEWTTRCMARADHRAIGYLSMAVGAVLLVVTLWIALDSKWAFILLPLCVELAVPGLRHFFGRSKVRRLIRDHTWHAVEADFVPGRRIGRQAYLEMPGSDRSYLRVSEMPERVRDHVRATGRLWMAGPDATGRTAVITEECPYLILGRIVIR